MLFGGGALFGVVVAVAGRGVVFGGGALFIVVGAGRDMLFISSADGRDMLFGGGALLGVVAVGAGRDMLFISAPAGRPPPAAGVVPRGAPFATAETGTGWNGGAALAATTPEPLNTPGLAVAAIDGLPWFTDARSERLVLAACWCCVCSAVGWICVSAAAVRSAAVGWAVIPPLPPL